MLVTTIRGVEAERADCIKIAGEFYEKEVDAVNIDGRWYRKSNLKIYFNAVENKYMKITPETTNGVIEYCEDGTITQGKFEASFDNRYTIKTGRGEYICASKAVFDSIPKIFSKGHGAYLTHSAAAAHQFNPATDQYSNAYVYEFERLYNSEKLIPLFASVDHRKHTEDLLSVINKAGVKHLLLSKYSFGIEIETARGIVPQHECIGLGLIPLRDGSIGGHEYTTIPMVGEDGINLMMNQFKAIKDKCYIDKECSMHVHFGNFPVSEAKILRLYNLLYVLQDEVGSLFHKYIFNTGQYKASGKDYCKKFKKSFDEFSSLYKYFGHEDYSYEGSLFASHPLDPNRNRKWENNCRYYFCNLINMMFGDGAKTVEFRLHTPTFNYTKVINWLFICMSILEYADSDLTISSSLTLSDVVNYANDKDTARVINNYIEQRKDYFEKSCLNHNDYYGVLDIIEDLNIEYPTPYHT